jgi:L-lactate dehydrogenase (cytochrome)
VAEYGHQLEIVLDGGLRSGPDIARALASGAKMVFLGRPFMWSVAALGSKGGSHLYELLHAQLKQVMEQLGCEDVRQLPNHLI